MLVLAPHLDAVDEELGAAPAGDQAEQAVQRRQPIGVDRHQVPAHAVRLGEAGAGDRRGQRLGLGVASRRRLGEGDHVARSALVHR